MARKCQNKPVTLLTGSKDTAECTLKPYYNTIHYNEVLAIHVTLSSHGF